MSTRSPRNGTPSRSSSRRWRFANTLLGEDVMDVQAARDVDGKGRALVVTLLDVAKGAAAVSIAYASAGGNGVAALTGTAAVVGHIYPVWLRFHGGKGVAVAAGVFAMLTPLATAITMMRKSNIVRFLSR